MTESTLTSAYADLLAELGYFLGLNPVSAQWNAVDAARVASVLKSAARTFYHAYDWSFLKPTMDMTLWSSLAVGTATVSGGSFSGGVTPLTATTASFYASMVGKSIVITDVGTFVIASYTSPTVVVVTGDAHTVSTKTFSIAADGDYLLADDFGGLIDHLYFLPTSSDRPIVHIAEGDLLRMRQFEGTGTGTPQFCAVRPRAISGSLGQRWVMAVHPIPSSATAVRFRYRVLPDALTTSNLFHYGGAPYSEALLACCLAIADDRYNDRRGDKQAVWQEQLTGAIARDRATQGPQQLGVMPPTYPGDGSEEDGAPMRSTALVTYYGQYSGPD